MSISSLLGAHVCNLNPFLGIGSLVIHRIRSDVFGFLPLKADLVVGCCFCTRKSGFCWLFLVNSRVCCLAGRRYEQYSHQKAKQYFG